MARKDPRFDPEYQKNTQQTRESTNQIQGKEIGNNTILTEHLANGAVSTNQINTNAQPTVNTIYANNWFRSYNQTGWYNETYGGGVYMIDSEWVRIYGGKKLYIANRLLADSGVMCFRGTQSSGNTNYLTDLDSFFGSNWDGFWTMNRPGFSSAFWQHDHGGSTGTIQWATNYTSPLYRRNRTDNSTWSAWRQVD